MPVKMENPYLRYPVKNKNRNLQYFNCRPFAVKTIMKLDKPLV